MAKPKTKKPGARKYQQDKAGKTTRSTLWERISGEKATIMFRGNRYWFYTDAFLRGWGVKDTLKKLRREGYQARLIRPRLSWNIVEIFTRPKHPNPKRHFQGFV